MNSWSWIAYGGACLGTVLAAAALLLKGRILTWVCFALGMLLLAAESALGGLILAASTEEAILLWLNLRLALAGLLASVWLVFSLSYARGNARTFLRRWRPVLGTAFLIAIVVPALGASDLTVRIVGLPVEGGWFVLLGWAGLAQNLFVLAASVLILVNLERTFREAVGVMRWRVKYMVLGLGLIFGAKLYTTSQVLVYSGFNPALVLVGSMALLLGGALVAFSALRTKLAEAEVYPSQALLFNSLTVILAGAYLVVVGVLAKIVSAWGGSSAFPLNSLLVFLAMVGLSVLLLSDRLRQRIRLAISRHFQRPLYDYRKMWLLFTERTTSQVDETDFCRAVVRLVSETFHLLSVNVWLVSEHQNRLLFAASTTLSQEHAALLPLPAPAMGELLEFLRQHPAPLDLATTRAPWAEALREHAPDHFRKGGNRLCVPLVSNGEVLGLLTVADRVSGLRFSPGDFDLLKCIADQVAASLGNLKLTQKLAQARELGAFQAMSAFFVHDLKNTASTLTLMLNNMRAHFNNPEFRAEALRGLAQCVGRMDAIIQRLTLLRQKLEVKQVETDLNRIVSDCLAGLEQMPEVRLEKKLEPLPGICADPEQLTTVITNLVLNAREALGEHGRIQVQTSRRNGWAVCAVSDNGCGMSPEFIARSLFKPFQTTKKTGLGIGMFHCRMIVEAHRGRIEVESEPGKGSTFRVLLPLPAS